MKHIRAVLRWHLKRAQIARRKGEPGWEAVRARHLAIVEDLARQIA